MRLALWVALLTAPPSYACKCAGTYEACRSASVTSNAVFVARVLTDSGERFGQGPANVEIEEVLQNVPPGLRRATIDTSSGNSCYFRLRAGERYVIISSGPPYAVHVCSSSFPLRGNEHVLEALRRQIRKTGPIITGVVRKSTSSYGHDGAVANAKVLVESEDFRQETSSGVDGAYSIAVPRAGRYRFSVSKTGYIANEEFNQRWSGRFVRNPQTGVYGADAADKGAVVLGQYSCATWDLALWPEGHIRGTVRRPDGQPAPAGVTVRAFAFDRNQKRESNPLRTALTNADGTYTIAPLPPG
ncbi:MAG: carboxypeptidase-like regulatory domain-containing protein, partial [Bryobacteraceae bacterium]|nr:carboxypeptidase-like regulatory domain-containing protein [Bryobacteraceae bacterium]